MYSTQYRLHIANFYYARTMRLYESYALLRDSIFQFQTDKVPRLGAALAYYALFSLSPLLILIAAVAGWVLQRNDVQEQLLRSLAQQLNNPHIAEGLRTIIESSSHTGANIWATIIGSVLLMLSASSLFVQTQDALNTLWGDVTPKHANIWEVIWDRLKSALLVLILGGILVLFFGGGAWLSHAAKLNGLGVSIMKIVLQLMLAITMSAVLYRMLPHIKLHWRDIWIGASVTGVLLMLGQFGVSIYFAKANLASTYGAATSFVLIPLWIYFSAQIFFFGAVVTWVYAQRYGSLSPAKQDEHPPTLTQTLIETSLADTNNTADQADLTDRVEVAPSNPTKTSQPKRALWIRVGAVGIAGVMLPLLWMWSSRSLGRNSTKVAQTHPENPTVGVEQDIGG